MSESPSFAPRPAEGLNYPNVMQMFAARVRKTPELTALRFKRDGTWRPLTWRGWERAAREIAAGLITELGVAVGDRVAIMAQTRVEWALCDLAIALCGAISVPIYATPTGSEAAFVLGDSGAQVVIAEHPELLRRLHRHEPQTTRGGDQDAEHRRYEAGAACRRRELCIVSRSAVRHGGVGLDQLGSAREGGSRTTLTRLREAGRAALAGVNEARTRIESAIAEVRLE